MPAPPKLGQKRKRTPGIEPKPDDAASRETQWKRAGFPSAEAANTAFWDNLSKIWLTKPALDELDRRNTQSPPNSRSSSYPRPHRPVTRRLVSEWRKHSPPTQSAVDFLNHCAPNCLKEIKAFARHGGPDLSDVKSYPQPISSLDRTMSSDQSITPGPNRGFTSTLNTVTTTGTISTRNSRPYDRNFHQNLVDGGVYPEEYEYPDGRVPPSPSNWDEINRRLLQPRPSLSPSQFSDEDFKKFRRTNAHAFKEREVTAFVIPIIEGEIGDNRCAAGKVPLTNFDPLTNGKLAPGNPDLFYGARPEQLDRRVRNELSGHIIPSTQRDLPIAPTFFLASKGPHGTADVAGRQACYDGALGARGIHSLQTYGQDETTYDNNAYTLTSIYSDGQLKMYTSRPSQPANEGGRPEYYMDQIGGWSMNGNADAFRQGAAAYRNGREWAKEKREEFIRAANARMTSPARNASFVSPDCSQPSACTNRTAAAPESEKFTESDNTGDERQRSGQTVEEKETDGLSEPVQAQ